jgi:hypothetical protein
MLTLLKRIFCTFLITLIATIHLSFISPEPAFASTPIDFVLPKEIKEVSKLLSNKQLIKDAQRLLNTTPETFCTAYFDMLDGVDSSTWRTFEQGLTSTYIIVQSIISAASAGAGSLASYAGIASAVSQLGLGGLTTAIAGMMGSHAAGAAATALVTSTVGGPLVMSGLLVGGTSAAAFGTYEVGKFAVQQLGNFAKNYCSVAYVQNVPTSTLSEQLKEE